MFLIGLPLHGVLVYFLTAIDLYIKYVIVIGNPGDSYKELIGFLTVNFDLTGKLRIYDTSVCIKLMAGFLMSWSLMAFVRKSADYFQVFDVFHPVLEELFVFYCWFLFRDSFLHDWINMILLSFSVLIFSDLFLCFKLASSEVFM